jgi:hypothetical protein
MTTTSDAPRAGSASAEYHRRVRSGAEIDRNAAGSAIVPGK